MAARKKAVRTVRQAGFTLVEIMVVITILGLMAAIVAVSVVHFAKEARHKRVRLDFTSIGEAVDVYRAKHGRVPENLEALVADHELRSAPKDPWERPYLFVRASDSPDGYRVTSLGADGQPGGEEEDADVVSDTPDEATAR